MIRRCVILLVLVPVLVSKLAFLTLNPLIRRFGNRRSLKISFQAERAGFFHQVSADVEARRLAENNLPHN